MKRTYVVKTLLLLFATVLALSACGSSSTSTSATTPTDKGPAPVITLDNTAPANIDFAFSAGVVQSNPNAPLQFEMVPVFYYQQTQIIQFKHGEKLECNGIALPMRPGSGYATDTVPAPGTVIPCTYVSPQGQASFSFTVPGQAKVISPAAGAVVIRSAQTAVTLSLAPGCQSIAMVTGHQGGISGGYVSGTVIASNGCATHQTINTLDQPSGPGVLGVQETETEGGVTNNTGFHSFVLNIETRGEEPITWH